MRGDSRKPNVIIRQHAGSPPHAWGQRGEAEAYQRSDRFTPTCVGTASSRALPAAMSSVHPHMRGDSARQQASWTLHPGSPPHAWGQPEHPPHHADGLRFTPTCVGTAPPGDAPRWNAAVHPHMRGDSSLLRWSCRSSRGSPPHAWGQLVGPGGSKSFVRFTPTCVGTAVVGAIWGSLPSVHPHMRGDSFGFHPDSQ